MSRVVGLSCSVLATTPAHRYKTNSGYGVLSREHYSNARMCCQVPCACDRSDNRLKNLQHQSCTLSLAMSSRPLWSYDCGPFSSRKDFISQFRIPTRTPQFVEFRLRCTRLSRSGEHEFFRLQCAESFCNDHRSLELLTHGNGRCPIIKPSSAVSAASKERRGDAGLSQDS